MTGVEIVVGYLFAWAVQKARRVGARADAEVDAGLDAAMDRLHQVVSGKLGQDGSLVRLAEEAEAGQQAPSDRTRQRVMLAVEDAAEQDAGFARALREAVAKIQEADGSAGGGNVMSGNTFMGPTAVQVGDHGRQENHFGPKA